MHVVTVVNLTTLCHRADIFDSNRYFPIPFLRNSSKYAICEKKKLQNQHVLVLHPYICNKMFLFFHAGNIVNDFVHSTSYGEQIHLLS